MKLPGRVGISFPSFVRARKSPWIETSIPDEYGRWTESGLVRARGLKPQTVTTDPVTAVRARKSPWIET